MISPLGNNAEAFFDNLAAGRSGIVRLPPPAIGRAGKPALENPRTHISGAVSFEAAGLFPALALKRQIIPPTINLRIPNPDCDLDYVPNQARFGVALDAVMSNSFVLGGINAVLICRAAKG